MELEAVPDGQTNSLSVPTVSENEGERAPKAFALRNGWRDFDITEIDITDSDITEFDITDTDIPESDITEIDITRKGKLI